MYNFFLAIREIDKSVTTETNWLHAIANQRNMDELTLDLKTKPMEDLLETKSLGSVRIDRSRNTVPINHLGMKEAQIPLEAMRNKIDRIRLQQKIYIPLPITNMLVENLFGCMICSDGNIIFADGPSRTIKVFNKKGNHIKDIRVPGTPSDITEISQGRIAVTYGIGEKYEIAGIKNYLYKTVKSVSTRSTCWGISCNDGKVAVKCSNEGIELYDINGKKMQEVNDDEKSYRLIYNIEISHRHIYYSYSYQNSVSCLGFDGILKWKYESNSLQHPTGITTDGYGNVYVVGRDSKNLIVISKDGQNGRELFKCKVTPWSVHFDKHNNQLLVRDYEGATVYDVVFGQ